MTKSPEVVIIGAGLSGLRAANELLAKGFFDVTLLEGRDRVGGRTHTSIPETWTTALDLGCAWIHGTTGNPLFALAEQLGAVYHELERAAIYDQGWISAPETNKILDFVFDLGDRAVKLSKSQHDDISPDKTFHSFCISQIETEPSFNSIERRRAKKLAYIYTNISAAEVTKQSLRNYLLEEELPGRSPMLASTYDPIIRNIARNVLDLQLVKFQCKVFRIEQLATKRLRVHYTNGVTRKPDFIEADAVIVTVPLGVLQSSTIEFEPRLPGQLSQAINAIGMGNAEKLFIKFRTPFWRLKDNITDPRDIGLLNSDTFIFLPEEESEFMIELISLSNFPVDMEPILLCFSAGVVADSLSTRWKKEGKNAVKSFMMQFVKRLPGYAETESCQIDDLFFTDWNHDEFCLGSYSYSPSGSDETPADCDAIATGWPEARIFFAGEHAVPLNSGNELGVNCTLVRNTDWLTLCRQLMQPTFRELMQPI